MFSSVKNFLSRHKRKFIVTGVVVGGTVLAVQYAQRKLREFQEAQAREFIERQRRAQHFESTEGTCNQAIMGLAPTLCDQILKKLNTNEIVEQIRQNPDNKIELWNDLKIMAFTRLTTLVYACSMLVVSLRVQLNILGGYLYKDTVSAGPQNLTNSIQQSYLTLSQHLLQQGIDSLVKLIELKVRQVLSDYDLKQPLTLADTEQIFWSIQMAVNSDVIDPNRSLGRYVLPPEEWANNNENLLLTKMYNETLDMLESEESSSLNTYNVSRGFSIVMDGIADYYNEPNKRKNGISQNSSHATSSSAAAAADFLPQPTITTKSDLNVTNINLAKLPLAKLIPIINGLSGNDFSCTKKPPSLSTSLITLYLVSDKVKMLGANVYEVFCQ